MKRLLSIAAMTSLIALSWGAGDPASASHSIAAARSLNGDSAATAPYSLVAWSELGMHCIDGKDYSIFSILPPYNIIHAQLIKKGEPPTQITSGVTITYQAAPDTTGSVNSASASKTNFWNYVRVLFLNSVPPETGLANYKTQSKTPQPMTYNSTSGYWEGVGIPTVPYDDKSVFNPFPMAKLVAKDSTGKILATASIVLSVSDEISCNTCHGSNTDAAAKPATGWVNNPDPAKDAKLNILKKHDDRWPISQYLSQLQTNGWTYQSSLYQTAISGTPVLCAACHSDNALNLPGLPGIGAEASDMHTLHGPQILTSNNQTLDQNSATSDLNSCYLCHPGPKTLCKRGAMNTQLCSSCHGNVSYVGTASRQPWFIEPACQMCHNTSQRYTTTFDSTGQWRQTTDTTFATNDNVPIPGANLYRYSSGHGTVFCSACHGSPHAEFPSLQANDNVYPSKLQGYAAKITECTVCHTTKLAITGNGGPHGLHNVGQTWVNGHPNYVDSHGYQACAYCHGSNYKGLALSESKVSRTFTVEGGTKTFSAGHQFSCYDCHNGPNGG
jgi:mono/diheme cytochrome c family protein